MLNEWIDARGLAKDSREAELAAAVMLNLFREGYHTAPDLRDAVAKHKGIARW